MGISKEQLFPLVSKRPSDRRCICVEDQRVKAVEKENLLGRRYPTQRDNA